MAEPVVQLNAGDNAPVYEVEAPNAPAEGILVAAAVTARFAELPVYDIRNGRPDEIRPYLLKGTIPTMYHWVPVNGIRPNQGLTVLDAFIRSAWRQMRLNVIGEPVEATLRRDAILLGTARAAMTACFSITAGDLVPAEVAAPMLSAIIPENGPVQYRLLVDNNAEQRALLSDPLVFTEAEQDYIATVIRCSQAILPIQGLNLLNDGHHYLSDKSKSSYKAFLAVEKQVWMMERFKTMLTGNEEHIQNILWHKAGHPVSVRVKEFLATSVNVRDNLKAAKLGSASARLPAIETDLKAAHTFVKVAEAVTPIWETFDGGIDASPLRNCVHALEYFPLHGNPLPLPDGVNLRIRANTRSDVLDELSKIVAASADKVAQAYGFYCSMVERGAAEGGITGQDTLRNAFSLRKLMNECRASFTVGQELYKDYQALKSRARGEGNIYVPKLVLGL